MITKELIDYIASKKKIEKKELIEIDLILHQILTELTKDANFSENYAFKGGTCLIKCHLDYYRFSEDLDFSWINQNVFLNKTEKQIRKDLSKEINSITNLLEKISSKLHLTFKADKQNSKFIEFGGSNKFVTFKLWHNSIELNREQFIKIQINYVEMLKYKIKKFSAKNILNDIDSKELSFLFSDIKNVSCNIKLNSYDVKEILLEKVRAIFTRRGVKYRDFIDIYFIEKKYKLNLEEFENEIKDKIQFMLKYEKYLKNLKDKEKNTPKYLSGEEKRLLLIPLEEDFSNFLKRIDKFLEKIKPALIKKGKEFSKN